MQCIMASEIDVGSVSFVSHTSRITSSTTTTLDRIARRRKHQGDFFAKVRLLLIFTFCNMAGNSVL